VKVVVIPTLVAMAEVYAESSSGGASSGRFRRYVELGEAHVPVSGYNPMTSRPVGESIAQLLAIDAEQIVVQTARQTATRFGFTGRLDLYVTVAAPGMWTDEVATSIEHVISAKTLNQILLWATQTYTVEMVVAEAAAQAVRAMWWQQRVTESASDSVALGATCEREGLAAASAGNIGKFSTRAADALEILRDDVTTSTAVSYLFGDRKAALLGYSPLGLSDDEGLDHVTAHTVANPAAGLTST
jgi:hypothetical protein